MPFAGYENFEECKKKNQDKDDPEAYCGKIKHQVEDSLNLEIRKPLGFKMTTDYAFNFNPAELKLIIESLESLVRNEEDPFFAATARNILQQIENKATGRFEVVEESAIETRSNIEEEYGERMMLKRLADQFHDSLVSITEMPDEFSDKVDELEESIFFGFDRLADFIYTTLTETLDPEQYNEVSINSLKDKIDQTKKSDDLNGLVNLVYDKILAIGSNESDEWRESLKEEFREFREYGKKTVKGKGWWGESERHSKARKTGKADFTYDFIDLKEFTYKTVDLKVGKDFTVLEGPITRAGPFPYELGGEKVVLYKQWDNLQDIFSKLDYLPLIGSRELGAHEAETLGFAYNFKFDNNNRRVLADIITLEDIGTLTDHFIPKEGWEVSIGFKDYRDREKQIIEKVDHLAVSLLNKEMGRCRAGGDPCVIKQKNHDQNLKEVIS